MIGSNFEGIKIAGISTAVPKQKSVLSHDFVDLFGKEAVSQFSETTGVYERRIAKKEQTAADFAYIAANYLLEEKKINREDIGVLIFITQTPDYKMPATACVLHKRLTLSKECMAFDINLGCSGYVYGIQIISALIKATGCKYGLLLVGDTSTKVLAPEDKSAVMLFGDSGSATLFENTDEVSVISTSYRTNGEGFKAIIMPAGASRMPVANEERVEWGDGNKRSDYDLYMNGLDVFTFTISEVPRIIKAFLKDTNTNQEDYDDFIFHQANCYIIKQIAKKCKLDTEKIPISMDRYGNTSVTSIPLTICDKYGQEENNEQIKIFSCGFGIGLSWGISTFNINTKDIFPIIETDDFYDDGGVSHE